jgi:photosystem II stability/assembly factor-like uncharacterized protein
MALAIDPRTPDTLYASTLKSGVFKSTDGGTSWSAVNSGLETDIPRGYDYISVLAIEPQDPNTLYAARHYADCEDCGTALFKTTNAGANWTSVGSLGPVTVFAVAIHPEVLDIVYAGTSAGVFKSTDAGAIWIAARTRQTADADGRVVVPTLAIDPQNPDTVYAADTYTGILKTTDAGATWTAVNPELRLATPTDVLALRINPQDPATIYAGTDAGVFTTTDAGANWSAVNAGLPFAPYGHLPVSILALDPQASGTIYIVDAGWQDIFKSTDGGASWAPTLAREPGGLVVRGARLNTNALAIDPRNPRTLYVAGSYGQSGQGSGTGVIKSTDGGVSWTEVDSGLPGYVNALAIDPQNSGTLYAGSGSGVFRSTNGGANWDPLNSGLTTLAVNTLAIDSQNPGTLYAGTAGGVFAITFAPADSVQSRSANTASRRASVSSMSFPVCAAETYMRPSGTMCSPSSSAR